MSYLQKCILGTNNFINISNLGNKNVNEFLILHCFQQVTIYLKGIDFIL